MKNKELNDKELEQVVGGWDSTVPDSVKFCPCCGSAHTTAGIVTGHNPLRGWICCMEANCDLLYEVYLEGDSKGAQTGVYALPDRGIIDLEEYKKERRAKGLM